MKNENAVWTSWDGGLDPDFDDEPRARDAYEDVSFHGLTENASGTMMHTRNDGRRKRRTVNTEEAEQRRLPDEAPPGWAEP